MFDKRLIQLRDDFDNKVISKDEFIKGVKSVLLDLQNAPVEYKVKVFDALSNFMLNNYHVDDLDFDNQENQYMQALDSDLDHYVTEVILAEMLGEKIFDFYNRTYVSY